MWLGWEKQKMHIEFCCGTSWKSPLGRPKKRYDDNINVNLSDLDCEDQRWSYRLQ